MQLTAIEEAFRAKGNLIGSVLLLRPQDAIDLVSACQHRQIAVFGAEGFYRIGQQIQPSMEHSFCASDADQDTFGATTEFLRLQLETDLWFEVMVGEARPRKA